MPGGLYEETLNCEQHSFDLTTVKSSALMGEVERNILRDLVRENLEDMKVGVDNSGILQERLPSDVSGVMFESIYPSTSSTFAIMSEFKKDTAVVYDNSNVEAITHAPPESTDHNVKVSNVIELGENTAPLYVSHVKMTFTEGDNDYTSDGSGHTLEIVEDNDRNLFKALNSKHSNTGSNPQNGIKGGFSNDFNKNHALYTENAVDRSLDNALVSGVPYSNKVSSNLVKTQIDNATDTRPFYGSMKIVQKPLEVVVDSNLNDNSTLSADGVKQPPQSYTESEFVALFSDATNVGPGYKLEVNLKQGGGYDVSGVVSNTINDTQYDNSFNRVVDGSNVVLLSVDDGAIAENLKYMKDVASKSHSVEIQNGDLKISDTTNANLFQVLDGFEFLSADISTSGSIVVSDTNNILDDANANARYEKLQDGSGSIQRLVVNYHNDETGDYKADVGVLADDMKDNYTVNADVKCVLKSTDTALDLWTSDEDVASNNNSVLVFQDTPDVVSFDKHDIHHFTSKLSVNDGSFAFFTVKKEVEFMISQEGQDSLFRSGVGVSKDGQLKIIDDKISTSARLSGVDLNALNVKDIRIGFTPRNVAHFDDIRTVRVGENKRVKWRTSKVDGTVIDASGLPSGNDGYVIHLPGSQNITSGTSENLLALIRYLKNIKPGDNISSLTNIELSANLILPLYHSENNPDAKSENFEGLAPVLKLYAEWQDTQDGLRYHGDATINSQNDFVYHPRNLPGQNKTEQYTFVEVPGNIFGNINRKLAKITRKRNYDISVKVPLASYDNLYLGFENVEEVTTYYQMYTNNNFNLAQAAYAEENVNLANDKPLPHADLIRSLTDIQGINPMDYWFKRTLDGEAYILTAIHLKKSDIFGFDVRGWYQSSSVPDTSAVWLPLTLSGETYADFYLPFETSVMFKNEHVEHVEQFYGPLTFSVDAVRANSILGDVADMSGNDKKDDMYYLNLNMAEGESSIVVRGFKYDVTHAEYIPDEWTPYKSGSGIFLKNGSDNYVGTEYTGLSTVVSQVNTQPDQSVPHELSVIVTQKVNQNTSELFRFSIKEYMLENFNILHCKRPVMRSDITIQNLENIIKEETKFIRSQDDVNNVFYSKLAPGMRVEISKDIERHDSASFKLKGDRVQILPHNTSYTSGRYSSAEEIKENESGLPHATESQVVRNVRPLKFRGYKNGQLPIVLERSATKAVMKFGTTYSHDAGEVWNNKISIVDNINNSVGSINLKFTTAFSMLPNSECDNQIYNVPVNVTFAGYTKEITNPLAPNHHEEDVTGTVDVATIHSYQTVKLVATRVKVYNDESYSLEYTLPDLEVYTNETYVVNAETGISDWGSASKYSDAELRSSGFNKGIYNFKRSSINVQSHVGYATFPRPSFYLEAFSVKNTPVSLPSDLINTLTRQKWYADVDLDLNDHRPFSEDQDEVQSRVSVPSGSGLVDVKVELNVPHELSLRNTQGTFSFDLSTNKLQIDVCVGLSGEEGHTNGCYQHFKGYVSELGDSDKWTEKTDSHNSQSNKLWNLKFKQLLGPLTSLVESDKESLLDRNIHVKGIPSYAVGEYNLDLRLNDSVKMRYYGFNFIQDPDNSKVNILFNRYTTAATLDTENWAKAFFKVPIGVRPLITTRETISIYISEPTELTNNPAELASRIRDISLNNLPDNLEWTPDPSFGQTLSGEEVIYVDVRAPVRMVALTTDGRAMLHELLHVTADSPLKVMRAVRPDILRVKSLDGNAVVRITADGQIMAPMLDVYGIYLHPVMWGDTRVNPDNSANGRVNHSLEFFYGNVNSMQSTF